MNAADAKAAPARAPFLSGAFYWSVRRELWENRALFVAPAAIAAVVLASFLYGLPHLPGLVRAEGGAHNFAMTYIAMAMAPIVTLLVVTVFYCLGALYNERRDRSILFWKSMPVSDLVAVLAKAAVPLLIAPAVACAVVACAQLILFALTAAALLSNGLSLEPLWTQVPLPRIWAVMVWGMFTVAIWCAPIWSWLLLASAFARRMPILWAFAPPFALCLFEKIAFGSSHLAELLKERLTGALDHAFREDPAALAQTGVHLGRAGARHVAFWLPSLDPVGFLTSPAMWIGLAVAALFLAITARLRRRQEPI